jgi:hypothetical protein
MTFKDMVHFYLKEDRAKFGFKANAKNFRVGEKEKEERCPWCDGTPDVPRVRRELGGVKCNHQCHQKHKGK